MLVFFNDICLSYAFVKKHILRYKVQQKGQICKKKLLDRKPFKFESLPWFLEDFFFCDTLPKAKKIASTGERKSTWLLCLDNYQELH